MAACRALLQSGLMAPPSAEWAIAVTVLLARAVRSLRRRSRAQPAESQLASQAVQPLLISDAPGADWPAVKASSRIPKEEMVNRLAVMDVSCFWSYKRIDQNTTLQRKIGTGGDNYQKPPA